MKKLLQEAKKMQSELTAHRRYLHQNAEVGFELPKTVKYIAEQLRAMGYAPKAVGRYGLKGFLWVFLINYSVR